MCEQLAETWGISSESPKIIKLYAFGKETNVIIGSASGYPDSGFFPSDEEAIVNARIMAAAPELLEALQVLTSGRHMFSPTEFGGYVCKYCGGYPSDKPHFRIVNGVEETAKTDMEKAVAAIAKATGADHV